MIAFSIKRERSMFGSSASTSAEQMPAVRQAPSQRDWQAVSLQLAENGFARFDGALFADDDPRLHQSRAEFFASCRDLPADYHCKMPGRNRRYGRFILDPHSRAIDAMPPVWDRYRKQHITYYQQQGSFNPEHAGERRGFASLTELQSSNAFLRRLILGYFLTLPWTAHGRVLVGAHLVEFLVRPGYSVVSSPVNIHQDGEPFTFGMLVARADVTGGENIIATPDSCGKSPDEIPSANIRARFTLDKPLQGWVVDDRKVGHYVSPVAVEQDAAVGRRTMLLIDFTPACAGNQALT